MVPLSSFVAAKNASIARPLVTEEEEVTSELEESDTVAGLPQDIKVIKGRVMVKTRRFFICPDYKKALYYFKENRQKVKIWTTVLLFIQSFLNFSQSKFINREIVSRKLS